MKYLILAGCLLLFLVSCSVAETGRRRGETTKESSIVEITYYHGDYGTFAYEVDYELVKTVMNRCEIDLARVKKYLQDDTTSYQRALAIRDIQEIVKLVKENQENENNDIEDIPLSDISNSLLMLNIVNRYGLQKFKPFEEITAFALIENIYILIQENNDDYFRDINTKDCYWFRRY
ncbi:MAG: hypothetical protein LBQ34_00130 [Alphaproteobacteria bacterium]|nr:hypothetical protein [Alphaproteobacteria bacterium]